MRNFRTFELSVEFNRLASALPLRNPFREQLLRAALSIPLNLAEGRGKRTRPDQVRFFHIAMGSLRECQAILIIAEETQSEAFKVLDRIGASLYRLIEKAQG